MSGRPRSLSRKGSGQASPSLFGNTTPASIAGLSAVSCTLLTSRQSLDSRASLGSAMTSLVVQPAAYLALLAAYTPEARNLASSVSSSGLSAFSDQSRLPSPWKSTPSFGRVEPGMPSVKQTILL